LGAFDEFTDARGTLLENLQDAEATGFGEEGEELGDGVELRRLEGPMVIVTGVSAGFL
jgi:hypothetical protein